jgi:hypothetical protein
MAIDNIVFEIVLICIHSGEDCGRLYKLLRIHLGSQFTIPEGEEMVPGKRYKQSYNLHECMQVQIKEQLLYVMA